MGTLLVRPPGHRRDVTLRPAATAMAFLGEGRAHEQVAVPGVALGDGDVLVAIELSTICGCALQARSGAICVEVPAVLGHESIGRVIAIGDDGACTVDGAPLRIGDRVVWGTTIPCGSCAGCDRGAERCGAPGRYGRARIGRDGDLTGAFASHVQVRAGTAILTVPESLPAAALAPAACAGARAVAAVRRALREGDLDGRSVRVQGAGLVGLTACAFATELGAIVELSDADPVRRSRATAFGAVAGDRVPEVVIDTTGDAVAAAIGDVAPDGIVVAAGDGDHEIGVGARALSERRLTLGGVGEGEVRDFVDAVAFLTGRGRAYPFAEAVEGIRPLGDLDAVLAAAASQGAPLRLGVAPGA